MWGFYPELANKVREFHREAKSLVGGNGHDFMHDLLTGQYALLIAPDPLTAALAWMAALCHSMDRMFPDLPERLIAAKVMKCLASTNLSDHNKQTIVEAALGHSSKPSPDDSLVKIILMDADKLANMGAQAAIRFAQFVGHLPAVDLRYFSERPPGTNFTKPGSVYWDIKGHLEWVEEGWFRMPRAKEIAEKLYEEEKFIFDRLARPFQKMGLVPYPFPEDFV